MIDDEVPIMGLDTDVPIYNAKQDFIEEELDAAQQIIAKELAADKGPDSFGGEDYLFDFKENDFDSSQDLDFDPNHDVARTSFWSPDSQLYNRYPISSEEEFPSIVSPEDEATIKKFYKEHNFVKTNLSAEEDKEGVYIYNPNDAWIQTYSGRRFTPTNPNPDAVVIQDIAHALSMQCRFGGHSKVFYSVAQHCVLVSYICNFEDAFWGLMHDASEAYLVDVPRPIKHSGKFDSYIEYETKVHLAICKRFSLQGQEPQSVKKADKILLATEARDLLANLRSDWTLPEQPLPFKIVALEPRQAKDLFMKRFFELTNMPGAYEHYLTYENKKVI